MIASGCFVNLGGAWPQLSGLARWLLLVAPLRHEQGQRGGDEGL